MKTITARYVGPGNVRGARIIVTAEGAEGRPHRLMFPYDHAARDGGRLDAVTALCRRLGWTGTLAHGVLPDGVTDVYTFVDSNDLIIL